MKNQIDVVGSKYQQIGKSPINQSAVASISKKPKINYLIVAMVVLVLVLVTGGLFNFFQHKKKVASITTLNTNNDYVAVSGGGGDNVHLLSKSDYDLKEKAIASSNINLCLKLEEKESSYAFNQYNNCVKGVAMKTKDTSVCKTYLKDQMHIDGCIWEVAVDSMNEKACETTAYNYGDCYDTALSAKARSTGDLNFCLNLMFGENDTKYRCIQRYAKNSVQCKEYFDKVTPKDSHIYDLLIKECPKKT